MPSIETSLAFFSIALLVALAPGPDNLFVLMQSASRGRASGVLVVLGLCTGLVVHTSAVVLGLAAIFAASAAAFTALKFVGAAYLAFLAWQAFRAPGETEIDTNARTDSAWGLYLRGILMNVTNPKVALFFLAFLPQFVRPELGSVAFQLTWFGLLFIAATLVTFVSIAYLAARLSARLRRSASAQRLLNRASALVFAGLALKLATSQR